MYKKDCRIERNLTPEAILPNKKSFTELKWSRVFFPFRWCEPVELENVCCCGNGWHSHHDRVLQNKLSFELDLGVNILHFEGTSYLVTTTQKETLACKLVYVVSRFVAFVG